MSKFVTKNLYFNRGHFGSVSTTKRALELKQDLHVNHGVFSCRFCDVLIKHKKRSTIKEHLTSQKHLAAKAKHYGQSSAATNVEADHEEKLALVPNKLKTYYGCDSL